MKCDSCAASPPVIAVWIAPASKEVDSIFEGAALKKLRGRHNQVVPPVVSDFEFGAPQRILGRHPMYADAFAQPFASMSV